MGVNKIGDILFRNNIKFLDCGIIDYKLNGHPTLNITNDIGGYTYYMVITSSNILKSKGVPYYTIKPSRINRLIKESYLNLLYIYKEPTANRIPKGYLLDEQMEIIYRIMDENFETIVENNKDNLDEIDFKRIKGVVCTKSRRERKKERKKQEREEKIKNGR